MAAIFFATIILRAEGVFTLMADDRSLADLCYFLVERSRRGVAREAGVRSTMRRM
jgi:hypothetical protein